MNSMNKLKNIALFIDADNISGSHYKFIHNILSQEGRIICNRIYGDFSKTATSSNWEKIIFEYGMEAIQVFRIPKKESTDNSLIVDCMKILYNLTSIDIFVIVSSDSDFSSLATEIRLKSKYIIGVGYTCTSLKLRNNCDKFIVIENIVDNISNSKPTESSDNIEKMKKIDRFKPFMNELFSIINKKFIHINDFLKFIQDNSISAFSSKIKNDTDLNCACTSIPYLLFKNNVVYDLRIGSNQTVTEVLDQMIDNCDREEILMSYIKSVLLNADKTFHQKNYGINRMIDFCKTFIRKPNIEYDVSKHNEYVIRITNFSNNLINKEKSSSVLTSSEDTSRMENEEINLKHKFYRSPSPSPSMPNSSSDSSNTNSSSSCSNSVYEVGSSGFLVQNFSDIDDNRSEQSEYEYNLDINSNLEETKYIMNNNNYELSNVENQINSNKDYLQ